MAFDFWKERSTTKIGHHGYILIFYQYIQWGQARSVITNIGPNACYNSAALTPTKSHQLILVAYEEWPVVILILQKRETEAKQIRSLAPSVTDRASLQMGIWRHREGELFAPGHPASDGGQGWRAIWLHSCSSEPLSWMYRCEPRTRASPTPCVLSATPSGLSWNYSVGDAEGRSSPSSDP